MNYWSDLFTPETYEAFGRSDRTVSGFRLSQQRMADRVRAGDKLICYMVRMSRWIGVLDVLEGPYVDSTPIFVPDDDPFVVRFKVSAAVWLPLAQTVPIHGSSAEFVGRNLGKPAPQVSPDPFLGLLSPLAAGEQRLRQTGAQIRRPCGRPRRGHICRVFDARNASRLVLAQPKVTHEFC